ncbi:MAG TPA: preQ(1) synthase [Chthoniobacteraceae bacterium]
MPKPASSNDRRGLKLLGTPSAFPETPSQSILETFENRFPHRDYIIRFDCADFTSLCPITGQPDYAHLRIEYVADRRCIETKSLKYYLAAYRNARAFNEEVTNRILDDLAAACQPRRMTVIGEFASRGGIALAVEATHVKKRSPRHPS